MNEKEITEKLNTLEARLTLLEMIIRHAIPTHAWPIGMIWKHGEPSEQL